MTVTFWNLLTIQTQTFISYKRTVHQILKQFGLKRLQELIILFLIKVVFVGLEKLRSVPKMVCFILIFADFRTTRSSKKFKALKRKKKPSLGFNDPRI